MHAQVQYKWSSSRQSQRRWAHQNAAEETVTVDHADVSHITTWRDVISICSHSSIYPHAVAKFLSEERNVQFITMKYSTVGHSTLHACTRLMVCTVGWRWPGQWKNASLENVSAASNPCALVVPQALDLTGSCSHLKSPSAWAVLMFWRWRSPAGKRKLQRQVGVLISCWFWHIFDFNIKVKNGKKRNIYIYEDMYYFASNSLFKQILRNLL